MGDTGSWFSSHYFFIESLHSGMYYARNYLVWVGICGIEVKLPNVYYIFVRQILKLMETLPYLQTNTPNIHTEISRNRWSDINQ